MRRIICLVCGLLALVFAVPSEAQVPQSSVADIRAELLGSEGVVLTISNHGSRAIEAWAYEIVYDTIHRQDTREETVTDAYPSAVAPPPEGTGMIGPGVTRVERLPIKGAVAVQSVVLTMVLYDDLSFEGDPQIRSRLLRQREQDARDLDEWIAALAETRKQPQQRRSQHLRARLNQVRTARSAGPASPFANGLDTTVQSLIKSMDAPHSPSTDAIDTIQRLFEQQRSRALRHLKR